MIDAGDFDAAYVNVGLDVDFDRWLRDFLVVEGDADDVRSGHFGLVFDLENFVGLLLDVVGDIAVFWIGDRDAHVACFSAKLENVFSFLLNLEIVN